MKAVRFHRHGGPEVLVVEEVPLPEPGPGEVRVRVRAAALNHLDLWVRRGLPLRIEMPHVGGSDFAGVIEATGPGVAEGRIGMRVAGYPLLGCGGVPWPRCGDALDGPLSILGEERNGACCEALVLPDACCLPIDDALAFEEAAAVPVAFLTAWRMLVGRAALRAGETLLVLGAGSGVGTAAVQIGRHLGARVLAVTSGAGRAARVRALGADEVIDRTRERIAARVLTLTGRRGANVVFEHVGEATWEESVRAAAFGGRIVTCGATTGAQARTDLRYVFSRQLSILGVTLGTRSELERVFALVAGGSLRPVIDRVLPLEDCRLAHEILERGEAFGKVVLRPDVA